MFDLKITDGLVYDGDGMDGVRVNIGIKDGIIIDIGDCADPAIRTISAKGHIVTPGFIDLHTHYDGCLLYTSPSPRDQRGSRMPSSA